MQVNWDNEKDCFHDLAIECSHFHSIRKQYTLESYTEEPQVDLKLEMFHLILCQLLNGQI